MTARRHPGRVPAVLREPHPRQRRRSGGETGGHLPAGVQHPAEVGALPGRGAGTSGSGTERFRAGGAFGLGMRSRGRVCASGVGMGTSGERRLPGWGNTKWCRHFRWEGGGRFWWAGLCASGAGAFPVEGGGGSHFGGSNNAAPPPRHPSSFLFLPFLSLPLRRRPKEEGGGGAPPEPEVVTSGVGGVSFSLAGGHFRGGGLGLGVKVKVRVRGRELLFLGGGEG